MELITPRLRLREFSEKDFQAMLELDSKAELHTYESFIPYTEETRQKLDEYLNYQQEFPRKSYVLAITIPPEDFVMGIVRLSRNWETIREWEIGWAVHPDEWGKGYATEAAWAMINWGFTEMNVHRIVAYCHVDNKASVRVMEKLGMHQDGRLRETRWLNEHWWDEYVYAVLEREWKNSTALTGF